jgi:hypothetical protein
MAELGLAAGTIVARNEDERTVTGAGTIDVVPAWRFLQFRQLVSSGRCGLPSRFKTKPRSSRASS